MKVCTFFGHHDCTGDIRKRLQAAILAMIDEQGVDTFYVGHQGAFDRMAAEVLSTIVQEKQSVRYFVVLAYLSSAAQMDAERVQHSLVPEGLEFVPRKYAIAWRNEWLISHSDCVIAHVIYHCGNAAAYVAKAERKGKIVVNIQ